MAIDASNLKTPYSSDKTILPDIGKDDATNRSNGLLTNTAITNHITTKLQANNILPKDNDVPDKYNEKMEKKMNRTNEFVFNIFFIIFILFIALIWVRFT